MTTAPDEVFLCRAPLSRPALWCDQRVPHRARRSQRDNHGIQLGRRAIGIIDGTFGIQVNGVNNGYVQTNVGIDPDTGLSQAQITFRPSSTTWLPDADIDTGVIRVYGESGSGFLPQGAYRHRDDAAAWKFGSGAANVVPPVIKC
jgi:hypothetical protein